jgi:methyl-accepting chemotaxis protein
LVERTQKRRLKNLLLDGRLQLRYVVLVTGVCLATAFALGLLIYQQSTFASDQIMAALDAPGMDWVDDVTKEAVREQLTHTDSSLVLTMIAIGLGLAFIVVTTLILMTHQMAGPLHRMAQHFDSLRDGRLTSPGHLRRGDQFHQVFEAMRAAHETLHQRALADIEAMSVFLDAAGDGHEDLRALVEEKRASLG